VRIGSCAERDGGSRRWIPPLRSKPLYRFVSLLSRCLPPSPGCDRPATPQSCASDANLSTCSGSDRKPAHRLNVLAYSGAKAETLAMLPVVPSQYAGEDNGVTVNAFESPGMNTRSVAT
jgi:hypothetical protein